MRKTNTFFAVGSVLLSAIAATPPAGAEPGAVARPDAARAAAYGYDAADATRALQAAIDSGARRVIIEKQPSPWIVDRIELAGDQELFFEPGVEVLAKPGAFHGSSDSLFSATGKHNIALTGPGAVLRMRRADYDDPKQYKKAEWRHVLNFHGCSDLTVDGLTLAESGGDGIYLGAGPEHQTNRHVVIRNVTCDRNYRQGISVITADDLLIERCILRGTAGTAPAAGIDFEPNHPQEQLSRCVMRDCVVEDNQGLGIHLYLGQLDGTTEPISIRIDNCVTRGSNARSASVATSNGKAGGWLRGTIDFIGCRFEDAPDHAGIGIRSTPAGGLKLSFTDCTIGSAEALAATSAASPKLAPIVIAAGRGDSLPIGGVTFTNCTVRSRRLGAPLAFDDRAGVPLVGVGGELRVARDAGQPVELMQIDDAWIERIVPSNAFYRVEPWPAAPPRLGNGGLSHGDDGRLPAHRVREKANYLVHAKVGETISLRLAYQALGKAPGEQMVVSVNDPGGKLVAETALDLGSTASLSFRAETNGPFRVACAPGRHTVRMLSCSHAVSLACEGGVLHLVHTSGDFFFRVPRGVRRFGLRLRGDGDAERVNAALIDPAGRVGWQQEAIGQPAVHVVSCPETSAEEVWTLRLRPPPAGYTFEDHFIELRGVPPVVAFDKAALP